MRQTEWHPVSLIIPNVVTNVEVIETKTKTEIMVTMVTRNNNTGQKTGTTPSFGRGRGGAPTASSLGVNHQHNC